MEIKTLFVQLNYSVSIFITKMSPQNGRIVILPQGTGWGKNGRLLILDVLLGTILWWVCLNGKSSAKQHHPDDSIFLKLAQVIPGILTRGTPVLALGCPQKKLLSYTQLASQKATGCRIILLNRNFKMNSFISYHNVSTPSTNPRLPGSYCLE